MLINGKNIKQFSAYTTKVDWKAAKTETEKDWLDTSTYPILYRQQNTYSELEIEFILEVRNLDDLDYYTSNLLQELDKSYIEFENRKWTFEGTLKSSSIDKINGMARKLKVTIEGVRLAPEQNLVIKTSTFKIDGNLEVPLIFTIKPTADIGSLTITIDGNSYKINDLRNGKVYEINGKLGTVREDGVNFIKNYENFNFPTAAGGKEHKISFSPSSAKAQMEFTITAKGRWK